MSEDQIKKHWKTVEEQKPEFPHKFYACKDIPVVLPMPGLKMRPVVGQNLMVNFVYYEPNTIVPLHQHEQEQITLVLEGELEFEVEGETRVLKPGDVCTIPAFAKHGAKTYDTCVQIDAFTPPRPYEGAEELNERVDHWGG